MKKPALFQLLFCLLAFSALSCSDDAPQQNPIPVVDGANGSGTVVFNGQTLQATTGFMADNGPTSLVGDDESHYNYVFQITDATGQNHQQLTYSLYLELFSAGADEFTTGTFTWFHPFEYEEEAMQNKSGFWGAFYLFDEDDIMHEIHGGQLTVTGSGDDYTITYTLTLDNEQTLTGSFTGDFIKVD